jgi:hypothetical protein
MSRAELWSRYLQARRSPATAAATICHIHPVTGEPLLDLRALLALLKVRNRLHVRSIWYEVQVNTRTHEVLIHE